MQDDRHNMPQRKQILNMTKASCEFHQHSIFGDYYYYAVHEIAHEWVICLFSSREACETVYLSYSWVVLGRVVSSVCAIMENSLTL